VILLRDARVFLLVVSATAYTCDVSAYQNKSQDDSSSIEIKMQQCLALIDKDVLQRFRDKGLTLDKSIQLSCDKNNRNAAQNDAVGFALEIQKSKDLSIFKRCGKIVEQESSTITWLIKKYFISDLRYKHICDYDKP
jgi:hypothetical protein